MDTSRLHLYLLLNRVVIWPRNTTGNSKTIHSYTETAFLAADVYMCWGKLRMKTIKSVTGNSTKSTIC